MAQDNNWVEKYPNFVNLNKVTGITIDRKGSTQEHIGTIKFTYETGATNFKYGDIRIPENKANLEEMVEHVKSLTSNSTGAWVEKGNKIVNLNNVNGIIVKENVGMNRDNMILFVYIAGGTDFTYTSDEYNEFTEMVNKIKNKTRLV